MSQIANGVLVGRYAWRLQKMTEAAVSDFSGVTLSRLALPVGSWKYLIDYLEVRFKGQSREVLLARMSRGEIAFEEGQPIQRDEPYRAHRKLFYTRQVEAEKPVPFKEVIVFEDEHLLVADKPPFLTVVPAGKHLQETLLVRLRKSTGIETLVPMHRIDRETSGLVMFTKKPGTRGQYQKMFETKDIQKTYEAIAPRPAALSFPLDYASYIEESPAFMQMHEVSGRAPNAFTRIECLEARGALAKYLVTPLTGKKHQIRIHFSSLGMPILNDQIYPDLRAVDTDNYARPLQLVAKTLSFIDPVSNQLRFFESQMSLHLDAVTFLEMSTR
jgi:tRNA pseudouridine32 synthase / 23S rRNA pseudouridine746 synthase